MRRWSRPDPGNSFKIIRFVSYSVDGWRAERLSGNGRVHPNAPTEQRLPQGRSFVYAYQGPAGCALPPHQPADCRSFFDTGCAAGASAPHQTSIRGSRRPTLDPYRCLSSSVFLGNSPCQPDVSNGMDAPTPYGIYVPKESK